MKLTFENTKFNEAFLYLAKPDACWTPEKDLFPCEEIDRITSLICNFELANEHFLGPFSDEESFHAAFRKKYVLALSKHLDGEITYRTARQESSLHGLKAVTRARDDIAAFQKGINEHFDYLRMNAAHHGQRKYLESLRSRCAPTTLNLLDYMGSLQDQSLHSFRYSFAGKNWSEDLVCTLRSYLKQMHIILRQSVIRGGTSADALSPVMSQLIFVLACIFQWYSGKAPTRTALNETIDGKDDVEIKYFETGDFKSFCRASLKLIDRELPDFEDWNKMLYTNQSLDKAIREAIKSLKELNLTGP